MNIDDISNKSFRNTRTCERCKASVPVEKVKLYPRNNESNWLVCEVCCDALKNRVKSSVTNTYQKSVLQSEHKDPIKNILPNKDVKKKTEANSEASNPNLKPSFCTRCNYAFKIDQSRAGVVYNISCPYCGKSDRLNPPVGKPKKRW